MSHCYGTSDLSSTCCHPNSETILKRCKNSFPSFQIRRIYRIYLSPDNAGDAASGTGASARSPRFSQTHSPNSVYIGIPPPPILCATVLSATYFCSWNFNCFQYTENCAVCQALSEISFLSKYFSRIFVFYAVILLSAFKFLHIAKVKYIRIERRAHTRPETFRRF